MLIMALLLLGNKIKCALELKVLLCVDIKSMYVSRNRCLKRGIENFYM